MKSLIFLPNVVILRIGDHQCAIPKYGISWLDIGADFIATVFTKYTIQKLKSSLKKITLSDKLWLILFLEDSKK